MMNLSFIDINCNREYNKKVEKLYNSAFPKEERIPIWLLKLLARKNKAKFYGINDDKKFIGLVYNVYYSTAERLKEYQNFLLGNADSYNNRLANFNKYFEEPKQIQQKK